MEKILNLQKIDVEKMHTVKVENSVVMSTLSQWFCLATVSSSLSYFAC